MSTDGEKVYEEQMLIEVRALVEFYQHGKVEVKERCGLCDGEVPGDYEVVPLEPLQRLEFLLSNYDRAQIEAESEEVST